MITGLYSPGSAEDESLSRHTSLIAADAPIEHAELCSRFLTVPHLRTLVAAGHESSLAHEGGQRFRISLGRSSEGRWVTTDIALGSDTPIPLTSENSDSQPESDVQACLQAAFPDAHMFIEAHLQHLACEIASYIESISSAKLPALYVDLAIDRQKRTSFCGYGVSRDESESNALAHAYAASSEENSVSLPAMRDTHQGSMAKPSIGMLVNWSLSPIFLEACQHIAESRGAVFFYFYPKRVNFKKKQIVGSYWRDGKWIKGTFPFPDVIYDRMRRKNEEHASFYEALSAIPITHQLSFGVLDKLKVYRVAAADPDLASSVIPFQLLNRPDDTLAFVERFQKVILKPVRGSNGDNILTVNKVDGKYEVFDQNFLHVMDQEQFAGLLAELRQHRYFIQQFVESTTKEGYPFHIRIHLMKDGTGNWKIVFIFPSFSLTPYRKITNHEKTFRGVTKWEWFLSSQFGDELKSMVDSRVQAFAYRLATTMERWLGPKFHEIGIDLGIDEHGSIRLFEANLNNVGMNFHEFEAAKHGIEYALFLASGKRNF